MLILALIARYAEDFSQPDIGSYINRRFFKNGGQGDYKTQVVLARNTYMAWFRCRKMSSVQSRPAVAVQRMPGRLADCHRVWQVSYTHLRAHETRHDLVCRLLLEKNTE